MSSPRESDTFPPVKDYYEELWASLPDDLEPPDLELRGAFARSALTASDRVLDLGFGTGDLTADLATVAPQITGAEVAEAALVTRAPAPSAPGPAPGADRRAAAV